MPTVKLDSVILKFCYQFFKRLAPNDRTMPEHSSLNRSMWMFAFYKLKILALQNWGRETKLFRSSLNYSQRTDLNQSIWSEFNCACGGGGGGGSACMYVFIFIYCNWLDVWFNLFIFMHCITLFAVHKSSEWWAENLFRY